MKTVKVLKLLMALIISIMWDISTDLMNMEYNTEPQLNNNNNNKNNIFIDAQVGNHHSGMH